MVERIATFEERFAKAQATDLVDLSFGYALLQADFPLSHYHNRIAVTGPAAAADVVEAAEEVLGGAGLGHRYVSVEMADVGDVYPDLRADLIAAGYECETTVTMVHVDQGAEGPDRPEHPVASVSLAEVRSAIIRDWLVEMPDADAETLRQLADRTALYERGAELVRLAVYDADGVGGQRSEPEVIASHANLYLAEDEGLAQFENLTTNPDYRGRGYGAALLAEAKRRSVAAGCDVFFLTADLDDWPRQWYERFGFVEVGRTDHFSCRATTGQDPAG